MTDEDYAAAAADIMTKCGGGPLRVFAYGSLLWKPGFDYSSRVPARLIGWHRAFCMTLNRFRGSPENPGLMLALDHGGSCVGEVFEVQPDAVAVELESCCAARSLTAGWLAPTAGSKLEPAGVRCGP